MALEGIDLQIDSANSVEEIKAIERQMASLSRTIDRAAKSEEDFKKKKADSEKQARDSAMAQDQLKKALEQNEKKLAAIAQAEERVTRTQEMRAKQQAILTNLMAQGDSASSRVEATSKRLEKAERAYQSALKSRDSAIIKSGEAQNKLNQAMAKQESISRLVANQLTQVKSKIDLATISSEQLKTAFGSKAREAIKATGTLGSYKNLLFASQKGVDDFRKSLVQQRRELEAAGKEARITAEENKNLGKETKMVSEGTASLSSDLRRMAAAYLSVQVATSFLRTAIRENLEFNKSMGQIATLIPGATGRIDELRESLRDLAIEQGSSLSDLSQGAFDVISAFGDSADTIGRMNAVVAGAKAGNASTSDSLRLLSAVTKAYGDTSTDALKRSSDLAFVTNKLGQTTYPEMASSIGRVAGIAAVANVKQEELFASAAALTGVVGTAAEVFTGMRGVLNALLKPNTDMAIALQNIGFQSGEAAIKQLGLQGTLEALYKSLGNSNTRLAESLGSTEALAVAVPLLTSQSDKYRQSLDEMNKAQGATDEALKASRSGIAESAFTWEKLNAITAEFRTEISDRALPVLQNFVGAFIDTNKPVNEIREDIKLLVDQMVTFGKTASFVAGVVLANKYKNSILDALRVTRDFAGGLSLGGKGGVNIPVNLDTSQAISAAKNFGVTLGKVIKNPFGSLGQGAISATSAIVSMGSAMVSMGPAIVSVSVPLVALSGAIWTVTEGIQAFLEKEKLLEEDTKKINDLNDLRIKRMMEVENAAKQAGTTELKLNEQIKKLGRAKALEEAKQVAARRKAASDMIAELNQMKIALGEIGQGVVLENVLNDETGDVDLTKFAKLQADTVNARNAVKELDITVFNADGTISHLDDTSGKTSKTFVNWTEELKKFGEQLDKDIAKVQAENVVLQATGKATRATNSEIVKAYIERAQAIGIVVDKEKLLQNAQLLDAELRKQEVLKKQADELKTYEKLLDKSLNKSRSLGENLQKIKSGEKIFDKSELIIASELQLKAGKISQEQHEANIARDKRNKLDQEAIDLAEKILKEEEKSKLEREKNARVLESLRKGKDPLELEESSLELLARKGKAEGAITAEKEKQILLDEKQERLDKQKIKTLEEFRKAMVKTTEDRKTIQRTTQILKSDPNLTGSEARAIAEGESSDQKAKKAGINQSVLNEAQRDRERKLFDERQQQAQEFINTLTRQKTSLFENEKAFKALGDRAKQLGTTVSELEETKVRAEITTGRYRKATADLKDSMLKAARAIDEKNAAIRNGTRLEDLKEVLKNEKERAEILKLSTKEREKVEFLISNNLKTATDAQKREALLIKEQIDRQKALNKELEERNKLLGAPAAGPDAVKAAQEANQKFIEAFNNQATKVTTREGIEFFVERGTSQAQIDKEVQKRREEILKKKQEAEEKAIALEQKRIEEATKKQEELARIEGEGAKKIISFAEERAKRQGELQTALEEAQNRQHEARVKLLEIERQIGLERIKVASENAKKEIEAFRATQELREALSMDIESLQDIKPGEKISQIRMEVLALRKSMSETGDSQEQIKFFERIRKKTLERHEIEFKQAEMAREQQKQVGQERIDQLKKEAEALKDNSERLKAISKDMAQFGKELELGPLSNLTAEQKSRFTLRDFQDSLKSAREGNVFSLQNLPEIARTTLDFAREAFASSEKFQDVFNEVTSGLKSAQLVSEKLGTDSDFRAKSLIDQISTEEKSLLNLENQTQIQSKQLEELEALRAEFGSFGDKISGAITSSLQGIAQQTVQGGFGPQDIQGMDQAFLDQLIPEIEKISPFFKIPTQLENLEGERDTALKDFNLSQGKVQELLGRLGQAQVAGNQEIKSELQRLNLNLEKILGNVDGLSEQARFQLNRLRGQ